MVEIRKFEGDVEQMSQFIAKTWRHYYQGRMPLPCWTTDFLAREAWPDDETARDYHVAAYDGTRLVGLVPGWPVSVLLHGREVLARTGTAVSVDPEYQRQGVAKLMNQRAMEQARERGCAVTLFYLFTRSGAFRGTKFWRGRGMPTELIRRQGHWVRPLDHAAVARWELWRLDAWGTRCLAPFARRVAPPVDPETVRAYRPQDLLPCELLIRQRGDSMDLARRFDAEALRRHLEYKEVAKTLVAEHEGRVAGLVSFCSLDIFGRSLARFGLIDLLAFDPALPSSKRADLVRATLWEMKQDGLIAAFMLRGSWYAGRTLCAAGFLPMFPEYCLVGIKNREDVSLKKIRRVFTLWR